MTRDELIEACYQAMVDAKSPRGTTGMITYAEAIVDRVILPALPVWRDIASAPKDGTRFIAWDHVHGLRLFTMHWSEKREKFITEYELWSGDFTFWQPLPEPPKGGA